MQVRDDNDHVSLLGKSGQGTNILGEWVERFPLLLYIRITVESSDIRYDRQPGITLINCPREPFSDETAQLVMGEGSAEMNPQLRSILVKSEAESVPRHGIHVENVSPINKHDITTQPRRKRIDCSDAQKMTKTVGRFAL